MTDAERMVFNAQVLLEEGGAQKAGEEAYRAMIKSAKALVQIDYDDVSNDPDEVIEEFEERFCDTGVFYDPFAGPKFANYLLAAHKIAATPFTTESAHYRIEEAQLFIEAVHSCYTKEKTTAG